MLIIIKINIIWKSQDYINSYISYLCSLSLPLFNGLKILKTRLRNEHLFKNIKDIKIL